jgi:hypothetical protein
MSRHGYSDDCDDDLALGRWRAQVMSAIRGKRGQKLLTDLAEALDAMPEKKLIKEELKTADGSYCALGVLGAKRGIDLDKIDPEDFETVSNEFDIAEQLAREIVYENDEGSWGTPEERWQHMRKWVSQHIKTGFQPVKKDD